MAILWHVQHFCVLAAIMKESTTKYAKETWTDMYEDKEYYKLLMECYEKCKVPKEQGQKRHKWRCMYCEEVFQCRPSLNYHRHKVCPTVGHRLKQYPIVGKGQRIVMKDQQAIVKGQLGKRKGPMASVEEDGMPHTIKDNLHQLLQDTQTQALVMTTPSISTFDTTGLAMGSENHEHVEVEGDGDMMQQHALEVENEEWGWSPLFCLLRDFPELRPPDFPHRPWKHTTEEFDVICKFLKYRKAHRTKPLRPPLIVLALKATWHFHFGSDCSMIEHYPELVEKLEHVSQDKEFVDNLSRMQHLLKTEEGGITRYAKILFLTISEDFSDDEQPTLEDDVSSFKATSESREHQEVVKRVLDSLIGILYCVMEDLASNLRPMWHSGSLLKKKVLMWAWECHYSNLENSYTGFTLDCLDNVWSTSTDNVDVAVSGWRLMFGKIRAKDDKLVQEDTSVTNWFNREDSSED
jgi:hypothetical protein